MKLLLANGIIAAALMGNPATVEELYQPLPEVPHEICMVNPDDDHSKDKDKHDKHDDKHDKDKHDDHHDKDHHD